MKGWLFFNSENTFEAQDDPFMDSFHVSVIFLNGLSDEKLSLLHSIHGVGCRPSVDGVKRLFDVEEVSSAGMQFSLRLLLMVGSYHPPWTVLTTSNS